MPHPSPLTTIFAPSWRAAWVTVFIPVYGVTWNRWPTISQIKTWQFALNLRMVRYVIPLKCTSIGSGITTSSSSSSGSGSTAVRIRRYCALHHSSPYDLSFAQLSVILEICTGAPLFNLYNTGKVVAGPVRTFKFGEAVTTASYCNAGNGFGFGTAPI